MSKLLFIIFIITTTLASCDGRERAYKSNKEVLRESNLLQSFSEQIKFIPEHYTEIKTDTILSNNFQVKIKYHSLEKDTILKTYRSKNDILIQHFYKNFEAQIEILKDDKIIVHDIIDKRLFSRYENDLFWSKSIMQSVWVADDTINKNFITLYVSFCTVNNNLCKDFAVVVQQDGKIETKKLI
jgi:hypothetical protein